MLHTIVIILVLATWARSLYVPPKFECKAHAGSAYWPDVPIWNRFYISIGGALLKPLPPAQSCYSGTSNQTDSEYCNRATESWFHSDFHGSDPLSVAYPNWQSDGCLPISLYDDPKDCNPEHFPKYVVNVSSASQVSETISFAVTHNVRLIVKGAGHDLLGR